VPGARPYREQQVYLRRDGTDKDFLQLKRKKKRNLKNT
jgi:hypothetical protein